MGQKPTTALVEINKVKMEALEGLDLYNEIHKEKERIKQVQDQNKSLHLLWI